MRGRRILDSASHRLTRPSDLAPEAWRQGKRGRLRTCPCWRPATPSVPVPSLPRIRPRRVGSPARAEVAPQQPRLAELHGDGLTWIQLEAPSHDEVQLLAGRFGWHPLDVEDILSRRVRPQRPTLRQLERGVERFLPEELELYFDDIVDASERIWDLLDNYKEVVEALEDTNESLISHQQNDILYVLTIFSVVLLPLTVITGFFGMNVHFPGYNSVTGFWTTLALFVVL